MDALRTFWRSLLVWLRVIPAPEYVARLVSDRPAPDSLKKGFLYIVGGKGYQKWACFRSPADEEEIIQLSLMVKRRPRWRVTVDSLGRPSIHPSVWQHDGTYAHFWIRRGNVEWCADSGKKPVSPRTTGEHTLND
jgi:hypothetical protein